MPLLPISVAPRIAPSAQTASPPVITIVALSVVALVAVVAGFGLVASSLAGWSSLSPLWGLGVSCAGLALVRAVRDRAPQLRA